MTLRVFKPFPTAVSAGYFFVFLGIFQNEEITWFFFFIFACFIYETGRITGIENLRLEPWACRIFNSRAVGNIFCSLLLGVCCDA